MFDSPRLAEHPCEGRNRPGTKHLPAGSPPLTHVRRGTIQFSTTLTSLQLEQIAFSNWTVLNDSASAIASAL